MDAQSFKNCDPISEGLEQCMCQNQHVWSPLMWNWGMEATIPLERRCALWLWSGGSQVLLKVSVGYKGSPSVESGGCDICVGFKKTSSLYARASRSSSNIHIIVHDERVPICWKEDEAEVYAKGCCSIFIPILLKIVMKKIHFPTCVRKRDSRRPGRLMFPSRLRCFKLSKLDGSA